MRRTGSASGSLEADAPKIRWQIGLPQDARRIVRLVERDEKDHEDVVEVAPSSSGRPAGTVRTMALRVLKVPPGHPRAVSWETTLEEAEATPKGVRKKLNPWNRR